MSVASLDILADEKSRDRCIRETCIPVFNPTLCEMISAVDGGDPRRPGEGRIRAALLVECPGNRFWARTFSGNGYAITTCDPGILNANLLVKIKLEDMSLLLQEMKSRGLIDLAREIANTQKHYRSPECYRVPDCYRERLNTEIDHFSKHLDKFTAVVGIREALSNLGIYAALLTYALKTFGFHLEDMGVRKELVFSYRKYEKLVNNASI